ncbi:MAG: hypothetical protein HOQ24_19620, partial [Mycobacteriaceae bacterium]|nr:hypothetical protein [Mycobacteriaceae bacterium]
MHVTQPVSGLPGAEALGVPAEFLRGAFGAPARTLADILAATVLMFPDEPAIDDDALCLTYRE